MYLKNLSVLGFKSFADKTSLNFERGITGIVGPNGCGKSNVADAIRWVLGEQSAKALRGGGMQDVIFSGTDRRKPLGMSEVSITIGDVDEDNLRAAGVDLTFNELTVTRRIFRDGGSEYYINKAPARLKDIQQLFMGTGVGRTSYSIMAQGNITRIIQSKPDDRRAVFEEAAGITRFKEQKKEALRKLDHTEQNLLRVQDLIREVKRQIGSLQRQAGKARRYKEIMAQLQHLEMQLARHHYDVLRHEIESRRLESDNFRAEYEASSKGVLSAEEEIREAREALTELENKIGRAQQHGLELKAEGERHTSRIEYCEQRIRELEEQNANALTEINQSEERIDASRSEWNSVNEKLAYSDTSLSEKRAAVVERKATVDRVEKEMLVQQEALRSAQSDAFSSNQELTRLRNEINALDLQKQGNVVRLEKLSAEKIQLEEEKNGLDKKLSEFNSSVEQQRLDVATRRETIEERQERLTTLQSEIKDESENLDTLLREQAEKRSRLTVLQQLEESHEGFSEGTLAALKKSDSVLGSLADKIRVKDDRYLVAVEAALGQQLQLVLTEHPDSAKQVLADLRERKAGKASIAALGLKAADSGGQSSGPGSALSEFVECDSAVDGLVWGLLSQTRVVEDLDAATDGWKQSNGAFDFVTIDGEMLTRFGVFTGGSSNGGSKNASSILARKQEIEELRSELESVQSNVDETSRKKGGLQGEITTLQAGLQDDQSELRRQEVSIATNEGEHNALQNSRRNLEQRIDTVVYEIQSLAEQEEEGGGRRKSLGEQLAEIESKATKSQDCVDELNAVLDELRAERDTAQNALTEVKIDYAAEEQLNNSLRRQKGPLEQRISELENLIGRRKGETGSFMERKTDAQNEIATSKHEIERIDHEREQNSHSINNLSTSRSEEDSKVREREESLRGDREKLNQLQEKRSALDVELAQKEMTIENLREKIEQKYNVRLDDIESECITITYADSGPAKVETVSPEEMEEQGVATNWEEVAEQVEALQERIDQMGPVNLVAIEEYEETEQRYNFLTEQHDDLVKAQEELMEVINKINVQTKDMFKTTFEQIRENFRSIFTEIFDGGTADLVLVDEEDLLESGVDIVARPPGKKLQSISLLSGGEQTMTAVALLFSIYQVKPSPFAVLDELDAPLDESNINRFLKVVQRFLDRSQFIIITHNKRTIGMSDVLYGVTMQEHGVSKVVSVKFHKDQHPDEMVQRGKALVPPPTQGTVDDEEEAVHDKEETLEISTAG
ncbi:MAG: chromosome segregation protein SMC [Verrucomicrobiales bacterium]|nr:chromosome segregation protein SMC [Verrucomicrobiales bacterium]